MLVAGEDSPASTLLFEQVQQGLVTEMFLIVADGKPVRIIPLEPGAKDALFLLQLGSQQRALARVQRLLDMDDDLRFFHCVAIPFGCGHITELP